MSNIEELFCKKTKEEEVHDEHWTLEDYAKCYLVVVGCVLLFYILWWVSTIWFGNMVFPLLFCTIVLFVLIVMLISKMVKFFKSRNYIKF